MAMNAKPKFETLVDVYRRSTDLFADRELFGTKSGDRWRWMTYREFHADTEAIRAGFAGLGVTRGDRVAAILNNRPEWAVGAYATYGLGASWVPMYEAQKDADWDFILRDCQAKVVLVANSSIRDRVAALKANIDSLEHIVVVDGAGNDASLAWDDVRKRGADSPVPMVEPSADDTAGFIYTSGTTGNPKGVKLSHRNFASNVSAIHEVFPMDPEDRSLSFLPWAHSFGQTIELHGLVSMGASMGIAESVNKIVDNLGEVQPTLLFSVPRIFNKIYDGLNKRMAEESFIKRALFERAMRNAERRKKLVASGRSSGWVDFRHKVYDRLVFSKVRARFGGKLRYAFSGGAAISTQVAEFIDSLGIMVYGGVRIDRDIADRHRQLPRKPKNRIGGEGDPGGGDPNRPRRDRRSGQRGDHREGAQRDAGLPQPSGGDGGSVHRGRCVPHRGYGSSG